MVSLEEDHQPPILSLAFSDLHSGALPEFSSRDGEKLLFSFSPPRPLQLRAYLRVWVTRVLTLEPGAEAKDVCLPPPWTPPFCGQSKPRPLVVKIKLTATPILQTTPTLNIEVEERKKMNFILILVLLIELGKK